MVVSTLWQRMERERLRQKRADLAGGRLLLRAAKRLAVALLVLMAVLAVVGLLAGH